MSTTRLNILAFGNSLPLSWLTQRLRAQGHLVRVQHPLSSDVVSHLPQNASCSGFMLEQCLISIDERGNLASYWLEKTVSFSQFGYAEVVGNWHPAGVKFGFMFFLGCAAETCRTIHPFLEALAPLPDAWLYCGPPGSASFTHRVFSSLTCYNFLTLRAEGHEAKPILLQPAWLIGFLQQHKQVALSLLRLSNAYLTRYPLSSEAKYKEILEKLSQPAEEQVLSQFHYAQALAAYLQLTVRNSFCLPED